jgi:hypothetical protein
MPFPTSPLPIVVEHAPGADLTAAPGNWEFVDITDKVRTRSGVAIESVGRPAGATRTDPQKGALTIDNRLGDFSRHNPLGLWWGKLNRNTPLRVRIKRVFDAFGRTVAAGSLGTADSGQTWSLSGGAASDYSVSAGAARISISAVNSTRSAYVNCLLRDVEAIATITVPVTPTGAAINAGIMLRRVDGSNYYMARLIINTTGLVDLRILKVVGGVTTNLTTASSILAFTPGTPIKLRFSAVGSLLDAKCWTGSIESVGWDASTSDTSLDVRGAAGVHVSASTGNTNTLPIVVTVDDLAVYVDRLNAFVPNWPPRWDKSGKDAYTPIAVSGLLRRLAQGNTPVKTPMRAAIAADSPVAWWPLEDGAESVQAGSMITGGSPMIVGKGVAGINTPTAVWAGFPGPLGANDLVDLKASTSLTGQVSGTTGAGWRIEWISQMDSTNGGNMLQVELGNGDHVVATAPQGGYEAFLWQIFNGAGDAYIEYFGIPLAQAITQWTHWTVTCAQVGANVQLKMWINGTLVGTATTAFAMTLTPIKQIIINRSGVNFGGIGHLAVFNTLTPSIGAAAMNAHVGEPAGTRLQRLCGQEGIRYTVSGQEALTAAMGAQPKEKTFIELARLCEDTDQGVLYELGFGLGYQPLVSRYNRQVEMTLAAGSLAEAPEPSDDDQRLRNEWTVKNLGGSTVVAKTPADDPVAGEKAVGKLDSSVDVNLITTADLASHATWRLRQSTLNELRWDALDLSLAARPALIDAWLSMRLGSRLTAVVANVQLPASNPDVLVDGYAERLGDYDWDVTLANTPAAGYTVGVLDSATYAHIGMDLCVLAGSGWNGSAGTFQVTSTGALWSTVAGNYPIDLDVGGQRVRVSSCAGAGNPQTFTVSIASLNGITKTHPAGTPVRLVTPLYVAL